MATNNAINLSSQGVAYYNGTGTFSGLDGSTAGKLLTSNGTGVAPSFQTAAPALLPWTDVTGTSQTIAVTNGYLSDNAGTVAFALPATAVQFSVFQIVGVQGAWTLSQAAGQQIKLGSSATTVGVTGSLASTNAGDCISCIAVVGGASTIWRVYDSVGNITVA